MPSNLISLTEPFFLQVLDLIQKMQKQQLAPEAHALQSIRKNLLNLLNATEASLARASVSAGDWLSARRPLVYWADEILTRHVADWENIRLELALYGENDRAWKFYVEGDTCLQAGSSQVAEVFYLAMVLGFDRGDIINAFRQLGKPLPGGATDEQSARKNFARELQMKIQQESQEPLQSEPLVVNCEPRPDRKFTQGAMAALLISGICLLVSICWFYLQRSGTADP